MKPKKIEDYENEYIQMKIEVMDELGYTEYDMDEDFIEDEVNRATDRRFHKKFGFDFIELYQ